MHKPVGQMGNTATGERRTRWKAVAPRATARRSALSARLAWTLGSVALLVGLAVLIVPPLFAWQAAVVQLTIDDYGIGILQPVPFATRDGEAFAAAVAGRVHPSMGREARTLDGINTARELRADLTAALAALPLRSKDVLIACVRAQAGVIEEAPGGPHRAAVMASDVMPGDPLPAELVPCRDMFAAIASTPARTAFVAIDYGDLRWDPRLGVVGSLVPALLDEECRAPFDGKASGTCWVLGSHDTFEYSGVHLNARRSFFSRALELAIAGHADETRWGGDGDRVVELDELVRFTTAWTNRFSEQVGDGTGQRPVLWNIGRGRVPLDEIPRGVAIIRAGSRLPTTAIGGAPADEPDASATVESPAIPTAEALSAPLGTPTDSSPPAAGQPAPAPSLRSLVEAVGTDPSGELSPLDAIPHLWRRVDAVSAEVAATVRDGSKHAEKVIRLEDELLLSLERFRRGDLGELGGAEDITRQLSEAFAAAQREGFASAWKGAPAELRAAFVVRNRAVDFARKAASWIGQATGGTSGAPQRLPLQQLLDRLRRLNEEIDRVASRDADRTAAIVSLEARRVDVEKAVKDLRVSIDAGVAAALAKHRDGRPSVAELRAMAASGLLSSEQYRSMAEALSVSEARSPSPAAGAGEDSASESAESPLVLGGNAPKLPRPRPVDAVPWGHLADHAESFLRVMRMFDPQLRSLGLQRFDELEAAIRRVKDSATDGERVEAACRLGMLMAAAQAALPQQIEDALRRRRPGQSIAEDRSQAVDALLRLTDARDATRIGLSAIGWRPSVRPQEVLALSVVAEDESLRENRPVRTIVKLASDAAFPDAAMLRLTYDRDQLRVVMAGGSEIVSGEAFSPSALGERDRLILEISPRSRVSASKDAAATLMCTLDVSGRSGSGSAVFRLPVVERLTVAMRGRKQTVEEAVDNQWVERPLEPATSDDTKSDKPIVLRPFPGHITTWDLALTNQSGAPRTVTVQVYSVDPSADGSAAGTDKDWVRFRSAVSAGRLPGGARLVASHAGLELPMAVHPDARQTVLLQLPAPPANAAAAGQPQPAAVKDAVGLSSTIGIVVADAVEQIDGKPRPGIAQQPRVWVCRVELKALHPRRYLDAIARWSANDRSIGVLLTPRAGDASCLPPGESKAVAKPLGAEVAADQPLTLQKYQGRVSEAQLRDDLRARWNGSDDKEAWLAVDVDGYPRARVFRVECGPAQSDKDQPAHEGWQAIRLPGQAGEAFKPEDDITVDLEVDVPSDFENRNGTIEVSVRQERAIAGGLDEAQRMVWRSGASRQVTYTLEPAEPPAALAVRAVTSDWRIPLKDLGFRDVDVLVEARVADRERHTARRRIVIDGSPPRVDVAPVTRAEKGRPAVVAVTTDDGNINNPLENGRRAGASGIARVEWGFDTKGTGAPEKWEPVPAANGGARITVPTDALAIGRHSIVVRAIDRVGFESRPASGVVELVEPPPPPPPAIEAKPVVDTRNAIHGSVTRGGQGQPGVTVQIAGAGAPGPATTGPDGSFSFSGLDPGQYELRVPETSLKNRLYKSAPVSVTVNPAPSPPTTGVELRLE
jgi:hypothetical protein